MESLVVPFVTLNLAAISLVACIAFRSRNEAPPMTPLTTSRWHLHHVASPSPNKLQPDPPPRPPQSERSPEHAESLDGQHCKALPTSAHITHLASILFAHTPNSRRQIQLREVMDEVQRAAGCAEGMVWLGRSPAAKASGSEEFQTPLGPVRMQLGAAGPNVLLRFIPSRKTRHMSVAGLVAATAGHVLQSKGVELQQANNDPRLFALPAPEGDMPRVLSALMELAVLSRGLLDRSGGALVLNAPASAVTAKSLTLRAEACSRLWADASGALGGLLEGDQLCGVALTSGSESMPKSVLEAVLSRGLEGASSSGPDLNSTRALWCPALRLGDLEAAARSRKAAPLTHVLLLDAATSTWLQLPLKPPATSPVAQGTTAKVDTRDVLVQLKDRAVFESLVRADVGARDEKQNKAVQLILDAHADDTLKGVLPIELMRQKIMLKLAVPLPFPPAPALQSKVATNGGWKGVRVAEFGPGAHFISNLSHSHPDQVDVAHSACMVPEGFDALPTPHLVGLTSAREGSAEWAAAISPEGQWDAVVAQHVLHHTPYADRYIALLPRMLRPGGCLLIQEYNNRGGGYMGWARVRAVHYVRSVLYGEEHSCAVPHRNPASFPPFSLGQHGPALAKAALLKKLEAVGLRVTEIPGPGIMMTLCAEVPAASGMTAPPISFKIGHDGKGHHKAAPPAGPAGPKKKPPGHGSGSKKHGKKAGPKVT